MATDMLAALGLDKTDSNGKLFIIQEHSGCEANFILSCVLSKQLKNKCGVCFVLSHKNLDHYHNVGLKLGYNLKSLVASGLITIIDVLDIVQNGLRDQKRILLLNTDEILISIYNEIKEKISKLKSNYNNTCLIVEDLTHFLDLGVSFDIVYRFTQKIINDVDENDNFSAFIKCHIVSDDDSSGTIGMLICHQAYTVTIVKPLNTGRSIDVSGHILVLHPGHRFSEDKRYVMKPKLEHYLFKFFDRGVKLFAPGSVR